MRLHKWASIGLLLGTACQLSTEPFSAMYVVTRVSQNNSSAAPITIITTVTNSAPRSVTINSGTCPRRFRIETAAGVPIALPDQICTAALREMTLALGKSYHFQEQWDGKDASGVQQIGIYRVVGQPFFPYGPHSAPVTVQLSQ